MDDTIKALKQVVASLRKIGKPLSIHCEALHIPTVERALMQFLYDRSRANRRPTLFCLTPVNQLYVEGLFGQVNSGYEERLQRIYTRLQLLGYSVQLHVHFTRIPGLLSVEAKEDLVCHGLEWMESMGLKPSMLVLGWGSNEKGLEQIAKQLRLRLVKPADYRVVHDYEL